MVTLRDLLLESALPRGTTGFHSLPGAGKPSLSQKNWVNPYEKVERLQLFINPTFDHINNIFGNEDALDEHLLSKDVSSLNGTGEWLQSEGDSVRAFYTHVSLPIQLAFQTLQGMPFIVQRSESGPLGPTNVSQTIDFTWGWGTHCLMIGELKRHGIIDVKRWTGESTPDSTRVRLGKELRGYCHKYKCFAASVFDGRHLLILVFHAETEEGIRNQNCGITGLLFSSSNPALRYGLFRAVTYQIRRVQAVTAQQVTVDGWVRGFRFGTWQPYWLAGNEEQEAHPNGYVRKFNDVYGVWFWAYADGQPVLDQAGVAVWDTHPLA